MLELFIARRYLSTRRKPLFVSFLLMICLGAVATGVFALIFVLSVMNGFEKDFRQRVLGFKAPVVVMSDTGEDLADQVDLWKKMDPRIRRVVPFVEGEAVAQTVDGSALGVRVRGVTEPPTEARLGRLYESEPFSEDSLIVGEEFAASLHVDAGFEEPIQLIFPIGDVGPTGDLIPRVRRLNLTGVFHSGFYDFDSKYALIPYAQALSLFGQEGRTGLELWVEPPGAAESVKNRLLAEKREGVSIQTWRDQNPKLFAAMKLEKIGMFVLLGMLLLIGSFNVFGLTMLTVVDKVKDMAVLRSVGLTAGRLRRIFLVSAAGIGALGAAVGGVLGLTATTFLQKFPVRLPSTYYLETLPIVVEPSDVFFVLAFVPIVTLLAAFYPAQKASCISPVEALRYE